MSGPDTYFETPADKQMALAVAEGDVETIERLLKTGQVEPLTVGRDATSWLVIAVLARQKKSLDTLLELGALGDPKGKIAGQALYNATVLDDLYWLKRLHAAGADLNNYGGGDLLLAVAMNTRNRATLDFYLEHGANLDMRTTGGGSVALTAADVERFDMVNEFLDRGASPWVMDSFGTTLGYAAEEVAASPSWDRRSPMNRERVLVLERLHAIGFPNPAPTPDEGHALREARKWPPPNAPKTAPRPAAP
ncbi:hypothetical protein [Archangium sp.]|uniref:ankyrin repeat domain-containing protein n=1 Tax=Archangium sp. TaxID=1872627 RepID=UPI002D3A232E|nr:hypothetical protein [Archangium sp.]HYO52375.1 hypothetical protein [Archangium sp.]